MAGIRPLTAGLDRGGGMSWGMLAGGQAAPITANVEGTSFPVRGCLLAVFTLARHPERGQSSGETQWGSYRGSPGSNASASEEEVVTGGLVPHGSFS